MTFPPDTPALILVSGSNGSGKTTICLGLIDQYKYRYIGADDIAKRISPDDVEKAQIAAGRIFVKELKAAIQAKESVIVESTLSGTTLAKHIAWARKLGYHIFLIHTFLENVELSVLRVQLRVSQGGHDVPEDALRRRFPRSRENFWNIYRPLAHDWELFYNSPSVNEHQALIFVALGQIRDDQEEISVLDYDVYKNFVISVGGSLDD